MPSAFQPLRTFYDAQAAAHRARGQIPADKLIRDLVQVANGTKLVGRIQLAAMFKLLDKVMPDLSHVTLAEVRDKPLRELTDAELSEIVASAPPPALLIAPARKRNARTTPAPPASPAPRPGQPAGP